MPCASAFHYRISKPFPLTAAWSSPWRRAPGAQPSQRGQGEEQSRPPRALSGARSGGREGRTRPLVAASRTFPLPAPAGRALALRALGEEKPGGYGAPFPEGDGRWAWAEGRPQARGGTGRPSLPARAARLRRRAPPHLGSPWATTLRAPPPPPPSPRRSRDAPASRGPPDCVCAPMLADVPCPPLRHRCSEQLGMGVFRSPTSG